METEIKMRCPICEKQKPLSRFYTFKDGKKDTYCKDCRLIGCSDSQPWTYFPIMQLFDIPYIEHIWFSTMICGMKVATNTHVYNNVFGKYYSKMKLFHWKHYGFKDSSYINQEERKLPFSYRSKLNDMRNYFLDRDIPQQYYNVIGLDNE